MVAASAPVSEHCDQPARASQRNQHRNPPGHYNDHEKNFYDGKSAEHVCGPLEGRQNKMFTKKTLHECTGFGLSI